MRHRVSMAAAAALVAGAAVACAGDAPGAASAAGLDQAPPRTQAGQVQDIKHLEPRPDSVGPQPERFTWSRVDAADTYTLRIWNEADIRVVSESGLTETSIPFPKEYEMPSGTYFWAVVGMRGDQPVAESGLAAFVVQAPH